MALARTTAGTGSDGQFGALDGPAWSEGVECSLSTSRNRMALRRPKSRKSSSGPGSLFLPRFATPDEVELMAAYVASPLSSATNGVALRVEGSVARSNF